VVAVLGSVMFTDVVIVAVQNRTVTCLCADRGHPDHGHD